ncbi:YceI family protein [Arcobacter sp. LA11]|uniref:YceI family protein n=1 Tax=Arcobacter sp. LA11 TaxID=1898176 RepID=UPI0009335F39|nr:YceI family protein [Arcobacter sp. LA11]
MKKFILILMVLVSSAFAKESYVIDNNNSNAYFKSQADMLLFIDDEIIGVNYNLRGKLDTEEGIVKGKIFIDSSSFDSDNETRNSHISEILNYQNFNNIIITIQEEVKIDNKLFLKGNLFVNGVDKKVTIPVKKKQENNNIIYTGKIIVKYSDFNIEPPTVAGGVIKKAKDEIEIGARIAFLRSK